MNMLQSSDLRMKAIKENTLLSFNTAGNYPIDFIEFDVQVTKDGCPIIFHDNFIYSEDNGTIFEKRVTELSLSEFLTFGPQREGGSEGKTLLRKTKDGKILNWTVESDDPACTLQEAFQKVNPSLGFNIELKFDDNIVYQQDYLIHVLQAILEVVFDHAKERPIIFSSFQPDATLLVRKLQDTYPVFFLTNGGNEIYNDEKELFGGSDQIMRGSNVAEAVYMQHLMGVDGVIVDLVKEIAEAVLKMVKQPCGEGEEKEEEEIVMEGKGSRPKFSQRELAFLLKLIPELVQHQ
ncbi:UNVERIFIED_CONTAM: Glycerophosphodiester phosphodiesterase GDPD2 [Sesamum calycinum]|uniref:glycerophosphodiester phosphodiesterase n=1 Tax=Sesamum calycinum TaxID=2727403 RepID=A0AAW2MNW6_9LAMI